LAETAFPVSAERSSSKAIFLSYASQDAEAARRIAHALEQAGIEVWFDQSELRGGEAWDASIRRQIKGCRLFLPIISASTQAREEGYFRREWNLAVGRTLDMADDTAFLLPVVIDATPDAVARVPERFREVQWTRLPGGETPASFVERVRGLMSGGAGAACAVPASVVPQPSVIANTRHSEEPQAPARPKTSRTRGFGFLKLAIPALLLVIAGVALIPPWQKKEHARNVLLPAIQDIAATMFRSNRQIFDMAVEVEKHLPNDPTLAKLWPSIATSVSIETEPPGAEVFWKDYDTPAAEWRSAGVTPLKDVKVPRDYLRMEVRKPDYQTIELAAPSFSLGIRPIVVHLRMDSTGSLPENMVRIPKSTTEMQIMGIEKYGPRDVPEFLIDKFEVTNKQFKAFVDAGGYTNEAYWTFPILEDARVIPLKAALATFTDRTGRQGPATWEAGSYPDGTENHPVTGVSWYEAAAYAAFAHKQLPTVFHWAAVADTSRSEFLLPLSNFSGKSTSVVGSLAGFSTFGVYDLAGNAREWTFNQRGKSNQHFILGGGWTDPSYAFNDSFTQPALDRSESNGFRCIKELADDSSVAALRQSISMDFRDYSKEKPVNDLAFAGFSRQFVYDRTPLGPTIEKTLETDAWNAEVVSIDAGYNNERLVLYIFLPKNYTAALQPVVFFSGSNGIHESRFEPTLINSRLLFIIKSGRALIFPIYKGTYERQDDLKSDSQDLTVRYKDHLIMWVKEYSRTIDYLETRKDMKADKVAYLGISWGGFMGGIIPAVEKRVKVVVLNVGGMEMQKALPEADQINYLPRVTQPVLMLNGKYDMFFPVESSQKPMFRLLGTPLDQKKMLVYESGHLVPATEFIKETLAWFDTYLGPTR
jgi:formylglycine-generating enzyme required for sulfatase activity/pimeloyl-ACP methyl ester carboxylesterase